jgi:riboflavin synthase
MFTGIIEEIGTLLRMTRQGEAYELTIAASKILEDVKLGDSISVNGICLTVTRFHSNQFTVDAVPETIRRTNLAQLRTGSSLNLERAMAAGGRFGGHFVSGHVDGTASMTHRSEEGNAVVFTFSPNDQSILKYILPKGSIAIDGISLTVMDVNDSSFQVSIIPHTLDETILRLKQAGDTVNLECDMIGKYIERFLLYRESREQHPPKKSRLNEQFLVDNGFA